MHSWRGIVLVLATLVTAAACGGGATGVANPCSPASGSVTGCVTDSRGGSAVAGATITATPAGTTTTTDSQGGYALSLSPGTYDITASKPGKAASKFQGVIVQPGQTTTANLIMPNVFDPTNPNVSAPSISVSGLAPGQNVNATIPFTVSVVAVSNPVRRIDVRTSNMNALPQASVADMSSANFTLNSTLLANGAAFVDIITYDLNQNVAEFVVGFTVNNAVSGSPPATPGVFLTAVTTGQSLGLFSAQRAQRFSTLHLTQDPNLMKVNGRSINLLTAPSNATLFVQVQWSNVGAVGYNVFRSFSAAGPFVQIAESNGSFYNDPDPSLAPGVTVYYRVSAFNAGGESAPSAPVSVIPLPPFNLNLASPANTATSVSTVPTFTWAPTASVGQDRFYDIYVQGVNDSTAAWSTSNYSIVDSTSIVYAASGFVSIYPLTSGKLYQWDIYEAAAQTLYGPSNAPYSVALAFANGGGLVATVPAGSLNGPFNFTTILP